MERATLYIFLLTTIISIASSTLTCSEQGFVCNGCESSYFCATSNGTFVPEKIEDCQNGTSCSEETGRCTSDPNPKCDRTEYKFTCHDLGMFPDPFDCTKYHICTEDKPGTYKSSEHKCTEGFSYDPSAISCNKKICRAPALDCENVGDINPVGNHEQMYSVCKSAPGIGLYSELFMCPGNKVFVDGKCGSYDNGLDNFGKCRKIGSFYSGEGCSSYSRCYGVGANPIPNACSCGYNFFPRILSCRHYSCDRD